MRELTIGSLFAGIGGLELGLERAIPGARTIWQVEQDPFARRVLAKNWPEADRSVIDVQQAGAHNLEQPDILCGGWPCQDLSNIGGKAGLAGEKSGLWSEFARCIGELRPRKYIVLENVPEINIRGLGSVLWSLASCGYDAIWDCIPAQAIGANHRRDRFFCVAWPEQERAMAKPQCQRLEGLEQAWPEATTIVRSSHHRWWAVEPSVGRVAPRVPGFVDRIRCLGNSVVPAVAEVAGHVINQLESR